jgi:hypothetical protein
VDNLESKKAVLHKQVDKLLKWAKVTVFTCFYHLSENPRWPFQTSLGSLANSVKQEK